MLPSLSKQEIGNGPLGDPEFLCKCRLIKNSVSVCASNEGDITRLNLREESATPFADHVVMVVQGCSKKQMLSPNTQTDIATVADHKSVWDRPMSECPRNSMNQIGLSALMANDSISAIRVIPSPEPTRAKLVIDHRPILIDLGPKPFHKGCPAVVTVNKSPSFSRCLTTTALAVHIPSTVPCNRMSILSQGVCGGVIV